MFSWSRGTCEFIGFTEEEALGRSLDIIVPEEFRKRHWSGFHTAMSTGKSLINDAAHTGLPVHCKDGIIRLFPVKS